jgi:catechol 2,3-dioxygenase
MDVMNELTNTTTTSRATMPAELALGEVHLTVRDLTLTRDWYALHLGLHVMHESPDTLVLGDGERPVLVAHHNPDATPPGLEAGLFHVALLYPDRQELARAAMRLATLRTPIQGASDHRTHEAIYLADAEGNGLELAADRPRDLWPQDLGYSRGPAPLDVANLMATIEGETVRAQVGAGLRTGHLHLHVGDIGVAVGFYRDVLGFTLTADLGTAAFFAAGGYHHHLGVNVWRGRGLSPARPDALGMASWSATLPSVEDVTAAADRARAAGAAVVTDGDWVDIADPWGMHVRLQAAVAVS